MRSGSFCDGSLERLSPTSLPDAARQRLASASINELDAIGERLLTAGTLPEALGAD